MVGRRRRGRASVDFSTGAGCSAALVAGFDAVLDTLGGAVFLTGPFLVSFRASRTDRRLAGPRTGARSTKTHPTFGTGLPPISRPSSKSHWYWPWNSWNESF